MTYQIHINVNFNKNPFSRIIKVTDKLYFHILKWYFDMILNYTYGGIQSNSLKEWKRDMLDNSENIGKLIASKK